jgi:predicted transcriptional regulator
MKKIDDQKMNEMSKDELCSLIKDLYDELDLLNEQMLLKNSGRKKQVYDLLKSEGPLTIKDISKKLGISTKNVSSQLTYLRSDNINIFTDNNGKKFIYED